MLQITSFVPWTRAAASDTAALLARLMRGDPAALDLLYRREAAAVYRYAMAMAGDAAAAADATHDAFVGAGCAAAGFRCGAWRTRRLSGRRRAPFAARAASRRACDPLDDEADVGDADGSPEELHVRRQGREALWRAIGALPWAQREALVLVDLQERPYAARQQPLPAANSTRCARGCTVARRRLAELLGRVQQEVPHE